MMVLQQTRVKNLIRIVVDQTLVEYQGFQEDDRDTPARCSIFGVGRADLGPRISVAPGLSSAAASLSWMNRHEKLRLSESTWNQIWTAADRAFPAPDAVAPVWRAHLER